MVRTTYVVLFSLKISKFREKWQIVVDFYVEMWNNIYVREKQKQRGVLFMKRTVAKVFDNSQVMGYVVGLKWFNKNGAVKKFMSESQMKNWFSINSLIILD